MYESVPPDFWPKGWSAGKPLPEVIAPNGKQNLENDNNGLDNRKSTPFRWQAPSD